MIEIGKFNRLKVIKSLDFGMYLTDNDLSLEILIPTKYIPKDTEIGDWINVFVYNDSENRPIATTLEAFAEVGDFAFLKAVDITNDGAFFDLGIAKDVFVSYREQTLDMQNGKSYIVYLYIDEKTGRIAGSCKWEKYIQKEDFDFQEGDEVSLLIAKETDLGYKAIINQRFEGLIYHNEVFEKISVGDFKNGFIKKIREEFKIDLSLQQAGYQRIENSKNIIIEKLKQNNGILYFGDKSSPEEIYENFEVSKKAFKKMLGALYKQKLISVSDFEIRLI